MKVVDRDEFKDLESTLEEVVDGLVQEIAQRPTEPKRIARPQQGHGVRQMQATYLELCRQALNPVVRYIKAMQRGVATKEMIEVMALIVAPLIKKTHAVGLDLHGRRLRSLQIVLQGIIRSKARRITLEQQHSLGEVYWPVHEAFALKMRGHCLAVANLLEFYRKLKRSKQVTLSEIRALFAIGIPSLTMIRKSSLTELISLTGIARARVRHIRNIAREFQLLWYLA